MPWYAWALAGDLALSALWKVAIIGQPRKAISSIEAMATVVISGLYVWAVVAMAVS
jgi:hypothetical protein